MENLTWDLEKFYPSYESEEYQADQKKLDELIGSLKELTTKFEVSNAKEAIETYLHIQEEFEEVVMNLYMYSSLQMSTNVNDMKSAMEAGKMQMKFQELVGPSIAFTNFIKDLDLDALAKESKIIETYLYNLKNNQKEALHQLSEKEELLYSKMTMVASDSWGEIQSKLTANMKIKVEGLEEEVPLSTCRNLAYGKDATIRKNAYLAELEAYKGVEVAVAMGLNNIKREANIISKMRGYSDILEVTLEKSHTKRETLNAMIEAIKGELPKFREYYKAKAKLLGYEGGLPFYEIFAPIGSLTKTYTIEEAKEVILDVYRSFSEPLYEMGKEAFENRWIDFLPKEGKVGGAFCASNRNLKEARVLTNFDGQLADVQTLAHELGHAYHGVVICDNAPLNGDYPMNLAETASIFCQTLMSKKLINDITDPKEKITVVENSLQEDTQCVVDILSRFLFESMVCDTPVEQPLSAEDFCNMMLKAQDESYGDGLDPEFRHPYMWLCKGHYYSAGFNFYNWPYAFGLLYAKGLYAKYLENKELFVKNYDQMLRNTALMDVEEVAKVMGIDVTKKEFWVSSLKSIEEDIDLFIELAKQN